MTTKAKTATAPAAPAESPALSFDEAEVPATQRDTKPNPYAPAMDRLKEGFSEEEGRSAKALSVTLPAAEVSKNVGLMGKAANAVGHSVRNKKEDVDGGKVKVTFWLVKRITRPRGKDDAAVTGPREAASAAKG